MAQAISNVVPSAQAALNSKLFGNIAINSTGNPVNKTTGNALVPSNSQIAGLLTGAPSKPVTSSTNTAAPASSVIAPAQTAPLASTTTTSPQLPQPITGNTTTPSGAVVNATTGGLVTPPAGANTQNNGVASGLLNNLTTAANNNTAIGQKAADISSQYGAKIAEVGQQGANNVAGDLSTGTTPVGGGNAAIATQSASARMSALAAGQTAALQGTGQQLTGNSQLQSGLSTALGAATEQVQAPYGTPLFNPATGTFTNSAGGAMDFTTAMQTYAQGLANNSIPYSSIPSQITGNPVLNAQLLQLAGQQGGGGTGSFNLNSTLGTQASQQQIAAQIPQWQAANTAAKGIENTITSYLSSNPGLNPSDLAAANSIQQWLQGKQLTDPKYQTLFNYLNEYTNTLAPILGVGGDTTNLKTEIAQSFVNGRASGASIKEVLGNISALADRKIQDYQSGGTGGGVVSSNGGSTGGYAEVW